tara:strand:+ start:66 stop:230 length:165 start_codon:yes stop_codon:yes gene_type:complete
MKKRIEEITDKMRKAKEIYELKLAEANQIKESFYKLQGQLELANELYKEKKDKK